MSTTPSVYEWYLRGYIEALAKVVAPSVPGDPAGAVAVAMGWRHAGKGNEPSSRADVDRLVASMI